MSEKIITKTVHIAAPAAVVWDTLTRPELMKQWLADTEINILTDWQVGGPIRLWGNWHGVDFETWGTVLQFDREKMLQYTHLSSLSRLPNVSANHTVIEFRLVPTEAQTALTLTLRNFPTASIYKHLALYWNVTLEIIKKRVEQPRAV